MDGALVAGLLQDIGILALHTTMPDEYAQMAATASDHNKLLKVEQEFNASTRQGWPLLVAFIDVDHFKRVNDRYGDAIVDRALVNLSRLISVQIRNGDVFSRYGGEEFAIIFPEVAPELALKVISRIQETIGLSDHTLDLDETFQLTISAGQACHMEGKSGYESTDQMFRSGDEASYDMWNSRQSTLCRSATNRRITIGYRSNLRHLIAARISAPLRSLQAIAFFERRLIGRPHARGVA